MTGVAAAADLPARMAPPVYAPPPLPVFTWTGFYFGINAGYTFDHEGRLDTTALTPGAAAVLGAGFRPATGKIDDDGFTGGGQIGYNYQFGGFGGGFGGPGSGIVVGIEADAAYTDLDKSATFVGANGFSSSFRTGLDYLGTVRGRLGYSFGQFLVYGTGGFAYGQVDNRAGFYNAAGALVSYGSRSDMETGYVYGGGIEYALPTNSFLNFFKSSAVTIKAEYLHYDLGRTNIGLINTAGVNNYNVRFSNDGDLVRAGLNYKF